jgi:hypothetical protein
MNIVKSNKGGNVSFSKASFTGRKCVMRVRGSVCRSADELLGSVLFATVVGKFVRVLRHRQSCLLDVFGGKEVDGDGIGNLIEALKALSKKSIESARLEHPEMENYLRDPVMLCAFIEELYDYWRSFERFLVCCDQDFADASIENRPYRIFNDTVEQLNHIVRAVYRDIEVNISGKHCRVFRQVFAGANIGLIAVEKDWSCPDGSYAVLKKVPVIRQVLVNPPLIIDPPMNKRTGQFVKVSTNPLDGLNIEDDKWFCYPAKVGPLTIHVFFNEAFIDLGCSLANLFELAEESDLAKRPDAVYVFGASGDDMSRYGSLPTVFYDDEENGILSAAVPGDSEFGYFGYLKKMILTLHNVVMMKRGKMPYHGAMVNMVLKNGKSATILLIGDTGAGKSETLEAFRSLSEEHIRDMSIIADDMGSLDIAEDGSVLGYGTEIGAFARLDDLPRDFAFKQLDRSIIMSVQKVNARVVLPVTTMANVLKGHRVDYILYANNYEDVGAACPVIESFSSSGEALKVFSEGLVMAKGTTTATGLNKSYFANIFGPPQYRELHDALAEKFFEAAFKNGVYVGQIRTRLGINGWESKGPEETAKALFELISSTTA